MFNFEALLKYLLEGLAVSVAAFVIPQRKVEIKEIVLIALTAAAVFAILDQFSPSIGISARQGAGFGIGFNQVGFNQVGLGHPQVYRGGANGSAILNTVGEKIKCTCEVDPADICPLHTSSNESDNNSQNTSDAPQESESVEAVEPNQVGSAAIEAFDGYTRRW